MRIEIVFVLISAVYFVIATSVVENKEKERFFISGNSLSFTTFTVIKKTITSTSTYTSLTTCTTSTNILSTCTTARRRRGLFYDESKVVNRHSRAGLFYNEYEAENNDGTVFLPVSKQSEDPTLEVSSKTVDESSLVPLQIEAGFSLPEGSPNRFLLSFGTSTVTSLFISYSTISLTAICLSTSGYPLCGGAGK